MTELNPMSTDPPIRIQRQRVKGLMTHLWSALAVAVTWTERNGHDV